MKRICLTSAVVTLVTGLMFGLTTVSLRAAEQAGKNKDPYIIFSNLGSSGDLYDSAAFDSKPLAGSKAEGETEEWQAVRFVPRYDVQVTTLEAAVGYSYGT